MADDEMKAMQPKARIGYREISEGECDTEKQSERK